MSICVALLDLNRSCEMGRPSRLFSSPREISGYKCYLLFAPLIYCKANKVHYSYQFVRIRLPACLPVPNPIPIPPPSSFFFYSFLCNFHSPNRESLYGGEKKPVHDHHSDFVRNFLRQYSGASQYGMELPRKSVEKFDR